MKAIPTDFLYKYEISLREFARMLENNVANSLLSLMELCTTGI